VLIADKEELVVVWLAEVAAPVGRDTVPVTLVMFQVPDCVEATVVKGVRVVI
jgi:hypothetical protein